MTRASSLGLYRVASAHVLDSEFLDTLHQTDANCLTGDDDEPADEPLVKYGQHGGSNVFSAANQCVQDAPGMSSWCIHEHR